MITATKIKPTLPDLKGKPYGGAWSIHEVETLNDVNNFSSNLMEERQNTNIKAFFNDYKDWAQEGHKIHGMELYKYLAYSNGTTETFDKFYMKHLTRRLRLWRGEYFYHQVVARENFYNRFNWIDDEDISSNDVVVVSLPFSDTGNIPKDFDTIMKMCCDKKVPVLVDMAYINISKPIEVNLDYECIETITTSLSKVFPVESFRIGLRMNRHNNDDALSAYSNNSTPYVNTNSIHIGYEFIKKYSNNYITNKYNSLQEQYCKELELELSNCVIFGLDTKNLYPEYNRGGVSNRLCFSRIWDRRNG